nr:hypothetical protein Q903MT_gene998 [Picea sitchensis]
MCSHPEIQTTFHFLVANMEVGNFSMILGREWQHLTGGYLSLYGSHMMISRDRKNIIISREPRTVPHIENLPSSEISYIETGLGTYSIFFVKLIFKNYYKEKPSLAKLFWRRIGVLVPCGTSSVFFLSARTSSYFCLFIQCLSENCKHGTVISCSISDFFGLYIWLLIFMLLFTQVTFLLRRKVVIYLVLRLLSQLLTPS